MVDKQKWETPIVKDFDIAERTQSEHLDDLDHGGDRVRERERFRNRERCCPMS